MSVKIKPIQKRKELKEFICLPTEIHRNDSNWVPPLYSEEWKYFNPEKNEAFSYSDAIQLLAYRNDKAVGRIMGIINHRYNDYRQEKNARFGYLECWDEQETAHALLEFIENWAKAKEMNKIVGPMGFTDQDPEGFLISGFEYSPSLATYSNFKYIIKLLENEGYTKEVDYVVYKLDLPEEIPEFYKKIYARVSMKNEFQLMEFSGKKKLKQYIRPVFRLMNSCFEGLYGYLPLDENEMDKLAKRYWPLADPRFIKIALKNNEVIGFIIGMPNTSQGLRKAKGHLFPFGIFHIIYSARNSKQLDLMLGGIKKEYRGRGLDVLLGMKTIESAQKAGYKLIDSHHELETNILMHAEMERLGGKVYKRYRIFKKKIR
jgi:predicted GNAT family acetyltransferase